uniref:Small ribosomal subunit protein mS40 n=1 Tax=Gopherus agassizii TaxID=38772 RepID=A0A452IUC0_9SAUR
HLKRNQHTLRALFPSCLVSCVNVKLLEQFICSHTGVIFHPTRTDVCMKQHKRLTQAIDQARDHGLLSFHIPLVMLQGKDYTNQHQASQTPWYLWICRIYKDYLKEDTGPGFSLLPPPTSLPDGVNKNLKRRLKLDVIVAKWKERETQELARTMYFLYQC